MSGFSTIWINVNEQKHHDKEKLKRPRTGFQHYYQSAAGNSPSKQPAR